MIFPETFTDEKKVINVVIETPCGSNNKYDYDQEHDYFKLNKILPFGVTFPLDFGFIPNTKGGDGDPLDVLVITDFPTATGAVIECRIIGVLIAQQKEKGTKPERNDRIIAVAKGSHRYAQVQSLKDLDAEFLDELVNFFQFYNESNDKKWKLLDTKNGNAAIKLIQQSMEAQK